MKASQVSTPSLAELATNAIRLGRELDRMAHAVGLDGGGRALAPMSDTLRRLAAREAFDPQDERGLEALQNVVAAELVVETVGTERQFFPTYQDEHGEDGEVRECPVHTARGHELLHLQRTLVAFLAARVAVLDRVAAQRALRDLLAR
jgi:hypothetical protein